MSSGQRERIIELDKQRIWRPYTEMRHYRERGDPLVVARASGARLFDLDGRSYIDGNASWWACALGHGHPRLVEALREQADRLCHTALAGVAHARASELADAICRTAPRGLEHIFYSDNGPTAVEVR